MPAGKKMYRFSIIQDGLAFCLYYHSNANIFYISVKGIGMNTPW